MGEKIVYNGIDFMKFVMAIVIVSIHVQLYTVLGEWYLKFQDYAVPLFFVFSSYFFFKKMREANSTKDRWKAWSHNINLSNYDVTLFKHIRITNKVNEISSIQLANIFKIA